MSEERIRFVIIGSECEESRRMPKVCAFYAQASDRQSLHRNNAPLPLRIDIPYAPPMESPFKGKTGLRRIWNAFNYSLDGLRAAYRHEDAFRQEVLLAFVLI